MAHVQNDVASSSEAGLHYRFPEGLHVVPEETAVSVGVKRGSISVPGSLEPQSSQVVAGVTVGFKT